MKRGLTITCATCAALLAFGCDRESAENQAPGDATPQAQSQNAAPKDPTPREPSYTNRGMKTAFFTGVAILGRDPITGSFGGIVASKEPAAGMFVIDARANVGAVAIFGATSGRLQTLALDQLAAGATAAEVISALEQDNQPERVSMLVLDTHGGFANSRTTLPHVYTNGGDGVAVQFADIGNGKDGGEIERLVLRLTADAELPLPERLFAAMANVLEPAGDCHLPECIPGGPRAFRSAGIAVARRAGGPFGESDRFLDVHVDFAGDPLAQLRSRLRLWFDAFVAPRLILLQRQLMDTDTPLYRHNAAWIKRLRRKVPIGQPK